jgi:hypothetical protein
VGLIFHNGQLLFVDGQLAMSTACCCSGCCSRPAVNSGQPNALPETLTATFTNVSTCGCADGFVLTLTWSASEGVWIGTGPGGTCGLRGETFRLACSDATCASGVGCRTFKFTIVGLTSCLNVSKCADAGCTCSPISLTFSDISLSGLGCCDGFPGSGVITVTITE